MTPETVFLDDRTVAEAKAELFAELRNGKAAECPCCRQLCKRYRRTISSSMALALVHCYRKAGAGRWFHSTDLLTSSSAARLVDGRVQLLTCDWAKLRFWGLIEARPDQVREDGSKRAGEWRITELGERFARGQVSLVSHLYVYNNRALGPADDARQITIADALGAGFDYRDLLGPAANDSAPSAQGELFGQ